MTHFISVDGEGVTRPNGIHDYVLLSVGDQSLHDNGNRLTFDAIMRFLYRQHQLNYRSAFIGFYLSYDFSQWLRELPEDKAWMLLSDKGIALRKRKQSGGNPDPFPVRYNGWEFDVLGMRRFKLRPATSDPIHIENVNSWLWICDSGPFWQTAFLNAIDPEKWNEPVVTDEEYRIIREGKKARTDAGFDENMIRYNVTENRALAKAMSRLDDGFRQQGWKLNKKQWFGPGQAADLWLKSIQAPTRDDIQKIVPPEVLDAGRCAYYGGWFEIPRHGHVPGVSYEYDINSAYPHIISGLPCLLHGGWKHSTKGADTLASKSGPISKQWVLAHVTAHGSDRYLGGLPHRDIDGIITRPHVTTGWYWKHEIDAALRAGLIDSVSVHETWTYNQQCRHTPFGSISGLYDQRLRIGKNTAAGIALKLVYNSSYGKFAQSVGNPRYANSIYASLITAGCRTMILDAIATHPNRSQDVLMVATDGIYFSSPHPGLPLSPDTLGMWDSSTKHNLTLFMPGVYWDDKSRKSIDSQSDSIAIKSRGINARELASCIHRVDDAFRDRFTDWPEVVVPIRFSVITPKLAIARHRWSQCGSVIVHTDENPYTKTLSSDPSNKRQPQPYMDNGLLTTFPYEDKGPSHGYTKSFGADIQTLIDNDELITDDGTVNLELVELLRDGT